MDKIYKKMMKKCLNLAKKGKGFVAPNPMVGCVITDDSGNILSEGYHQKYGENHAERNAILNCNKDLKGSTLYVNLEPCSHFGKTPPCADLIIEKGIKKVVCAMSDPNPIVSGNGFKKLKNAGIEVVTGILEDEAKELNKVFIKNITKKKPYVLIKTATTLDSKIALSNGKSKWITDDYSRQIVHKLRSSYQAIMTGSGTVLADNPNLTARIKNGKNPIRIIMDKKGVIPLDYNVFKDNTEKIILITNSNKTYHSHIQKIDFECYDTLFKTLYSLDVYDVLIEGGQGLNSSIIAANEADEITMFMAPKIFGGGKSFIDGFCFENPDDCIHLKDLSIKKLKNDILITGKFLYDKEEMQNSLQ